MSLAYQWAKRASCRPNWEKYDATLELLVKLEPGGTDPIVSERVALSRRKYGDRRLRLTRGQLDSDGYATNKEAWVPPARAVIKVEVAGDRELHTVLSRAGWLVPNGAGPSVGRDVTVGEFRLSAPVDVTKRREGVAGGKKVAAVGAVYEESVVEYRREAEVQKSIWKKRVQGASWGGEPGMGETLCAVLPGCRVALRPLSERPTGRVVRVLGHEDFAPVAETAVGAEGMSAAGVSVFSNAKLDDLARRAGLGGRAGVRGAVWERMGGGPKDARRPFAWHRLVEVELSVEGVKLRGPRAAVEEALAMFLSGRGNAFSIG